MFGSMEFSIHQRMNNLTDYQKAIVFPLLSHFLDIASLLPSSDKRFKEQFELISQFEDFLNDMRDDHPDIFKSYIQDRFPEYADTECQEE